MTTARRGMSGGAAKALSRRKPAAPSGDADPVRRPGGMVASLQQQPGGGGLLQVALSDIATHPDNRTHAGIGDVSELADSIRALGVLEPILLVPAADHLTERPEHREAIGDRTWVLVAGERRTTAAAQAGLEVIPAIVRADLTGAEGLSAMAAENMHRLGMHPLDEAALFNLQTELGFSQRQIAERTGCSQGHVSKRLALLHLPQPVQDALGTGDIDLTDAQALSRLDAAGQQEAWSRHQEDGVPLAAAAVAVAAERSTAEAEARLRAEVEEDGLQVIDAVALFGDDAATYRLTTAVAVEQAAAEGRLLVDVTGGQRRDYRAATPATASSAPTPPAGEGATSSASETVPDPSASSAASVGESAVGASAERTEQAERARARRARHEACVRACAGRPNAALLNAGLLQATLRRVDLRAHGVVELAGQFLHDCRDQGTGGDDWLFSLPADADEAIQRRAGWALLLAARELRARETHRVWDDLDVQHLSDLATIAGLRPTPWEQSRLDAAVEASTQRRATLSTSSTSTTSPSLEDQ